MSPQINRNVLLLCTSAVLALALIQSATASNVGLSTQQVRTAAPLPLSTWATVSLEGTSTAFARADHVHAASDFLSAAGILVAMTTGGTSTESLACGASPCAVGTSTLAVLNTSTNHFQCLSQNMGDAAGLLRARSYEHGVLDGVPVRAQGGCFFDGD